METLARHNSPLIMSQCGSKGSAINIAQVGQHLVKGCTLACSVCPLFFQNQCNVCPVLIEKRTV